MRLGFVARHSRGGVYTSVVFATEHTASAPNVLGLGVSRRAVLGVSAVIALALLALLVLRGSAYLPFVGGAGAQAAITGLVRESGQGGVGPILHAELSVTGRTTSGVRVVRHVMTDKHGKFALDVPPGWYTVRPISPGGGLPAKSVTVTRGHSAQFRFWFNFL
jgi:hypothetical protein